MQRIGGDPMAEEKRCCEHCDDGDGFSVFPYYGLAPHKHVGKSMIGSTVILDKSEWPDNFHEDPECEGCGSYTHCPHCGIGSN